MYSSTPILMIIFLFAFFPLILAEVARKKSVPTVEDFFLQSRKMPTFLLFFTVYSTWMSAFAFLGSGAYFYEKGPVYMTAVAWDALFGILFMVVGRRIWFYGKKRGYMTPTDFFHDIFRSRVLDVTITCIMVAFTIPYLQIQLSGGAYLIEIATNGAIPWRICGLIFYLIIIIYLWAGGLRAVAMTDVFYGICLITTMFIAGFYLIQKAGGVEYVFHTIASSDAGHLTLPGPGGNAGALLWISMFIIVPVGALMGPQMWVRAFAAQKKRTFDIMPLLICIGSIQCIGTLLAGTAGILLAPEIEQTDTIVPVLIVRFGTPILSAILFCGIASAALSTANSQIHAVAAIYTIDIHRRYMRKKKSEQGLVAVGKWAVLMISAIAYLLLLKNSGLIIDTGAVAMGGTAQVFIPTVGALYWKRANATSACLGIFTGIGLLLGLTFFTSLNASYCAVMAFLSNGLVFFVGGFGFKGNTKTQARILRYKKEFEEDEIE